MYRPRLFAACMIPALLSAPQAGAHDLVVSYEIESGETTTFAVFARLLGYPVQDRRFIANCDSMFIEDDGTNPFIADLNCDAVLISTDVEDDAVVVSHGDDGETRFALEAGYHSLNGLPFLIMAQPKIAEPPSPSTAQSPI